MKHLLFATVGLTALIAGYCHAWATDPVGGQAVLERVFKEFTPKGLKIGTFDVFPSIDARVDYTSNVLKSSSNVESERIYRTRANISASRKSERYDVDLSGMAEKLIYQKTDDFDQINFTGYAGLTYRFSPMIEGKISADVAQRHQTKYDTATLQSAFDPIKIDEYGVDGLLKLRPGFIGWDISSGYKEFSHSDTSLTATGAPVIQKDRDRAEYYVGVDARFNRFGQGEAGVTPFIGFNLNRTDFDHRDYVAATGGFTGVEQSNNRYNVTAGIEMDSGAKLRGVVRAGYGIYDPDDSSLDRQGSGVVDIDLTYLYTPLTNLMFGVERFFTNDTDTTGGVLQTRLNASVVHELTRRWILNAGVGYMERSFGTNAEDTTWDGTVGFTHRINERFSLDGDIKYISRDSNQTNGDYDETRAMIRLKTKF